MRNFTKMLIMFIFSVLLISSFICLFNIENKTSYAVASSTSDLQLMARAINGEARGEPYEGQVAVRCCYFE